jgi:hypothetical protein
MTVMGTWKFTVTRRDGSQHRQTEQHGRPPRVGDEIECKDETGCTIRARIESFHHDPPKLAGLGVWEIAAKEI